MLTTSEAGKRILTSIADGVILRFLERAKNSQEEEVFTNLRYISEYIVEPYKVLPYTLYWYENVDETAMLTYLSSIVKNKLIRYIPIISNMDAATFLPDVSKSFVENIKEGNTLDSFGMNENSPIDSTETITTPYMKNKASNSENKNLDRNYTDPNTELKIFKFSKEFSNILTHITDALESIIKEYHQLY